MLTPRFVETVYVSRFARSIDRKCRPCLSCNKGIIFFRTEKCRYCIARSIEHAIPLLHGVNKKAWTCDTVRHSTSQQSFNKFKRTPMCSRISRVGVSMISECYYMRAYTHYGIISIN